MTFVGRVYARAVYLFRLFPTELPLFRIVSYMDVGNIIMFNKQKRFFGIPYNFLRKKIYREIWAHIVNMLIYLCINMEMVLRNVFIQHRVSKWNKQTYTYTSNIWIHTFNFSTVIFWFFCIVQYILFMQKITPNIRAGFDFIFIWTNSDLSIKWLFSKLFQFSNLIVYIIVYIIMKNFNQLVN